MAGLDTRGAFDGFVQGFGLVNNYLNQQKQNERADQQMGLQMRAAERADQQMGLQMRNQEMREQEFAAQQEDRQRQQDQQQIAQFYQGWASGIEAPITPELEAVFERNKMADPRHLFNPKTEAAVSYAERLAGGEGRLFSQETVEAMNDFYAPRVGRGKGGKKRLAGIYPGQREGTLVFDLEVEDDKGFKYNAPMTVNRGTADEDDEVAQYDIEQAIGPVMGARQVYQALGANRDKMLGYLRGAGYLPKEEGRWETFELPDGTRIKRNVATGDEVLVQGRRAVGEKGWIDPKAKLALEMIDNQIRRIDKQLENPMALEEADVTALRQQRQALEAQSAALAAEIGLPGFSQGQQQGEQGESTGPVKVTSKAEYQALPPGTVYVAPDGQRRIKPAGGDQPTRSKPAQQPPQEQPRQPAQPVDWRSRLEEHFASAQEGTRAQQERYAEARNYRPVTANLQMPEQPRRPWDNAGLTLPPGFPR